MFSNEIDVNPLYFRYPMGMLIYSYLSAMVIVYGIADSIEWVKAKWFCLRKTMPFCINQPREKDLFSNGKEGTRSIDYWQNKTAYLKFKNGRNTITNVVIQVLVGCMWSAHVYYCCWTFRGMSFEEKSTCAYWTKCKCDEILQKVSTSQTLLKLAPDVQSFLKDLVQANLEDTIKLLDHVSTDIMSRPSSWLMQYALCRLRSKFCENGMFTASVAVHGLFVACQNNDLGPDDTLFKKHYRKKVCMMSSLAIFTCEKCVYPFDGDLAYIRTPSSELLLRTIMTVQEGKFRRRLAFDHDRTQHSYKDNLILDLSFNSNLGLLISECSTATLERMLWIVDSKSKYFSRERWLELKEFRKVLVADLRNFEILELIHYSMAGIVFLNGKSDKFFRLIGNIDAPVRLTCMLPKPKFQDILKAGLSKSCGDGNFVMCNIPGVEGHLKAVHVGRALLFVKCTERTKFVARPDQEIL